MHEEPPRDSFEAEIAANQAASAVEAEMIHRDTADSSIEIRARGGFITELELTSPGDGERKSILYSGEDVTVPKLVASHATMPAGPSEGVGGQHGPIRWADVHEFALPDGAHGEKRFATQMKRSDNGLSHATTYELTGNTLTRHATIANPGPDEAETSKAEHDYYATPEDQIHLVKINGQSFDELLGEGALDFLLHDEDGTLYWRRDQGFDGVATIEFPDGRIVRLTVDFDGTTEYPPLIQFWHRPGTDSLAVEPTVGMITDAQNDGLKLEPYGSATLTTTIELL